MAAPYHLMGDMVREKGLIAKSSNYTLYGDMSGRVMETLSSFTPEIEIYSIDECFLNLSGFESRDLRAFAQLVRQTVLRDTGIPTCVGIGPTKVLAKMANKLAKATKHSPTGGIYSLRDLKVREDALSKYPVGDVWGIGRQSAEKLKKYGIYTAKELRDSDPQLVQKLLTVVGARIQDELKGKSCLPLTLVAADKKQILSSKSFGKPVFSEEELFEACSTYLTNATEKLRRQKCRCHALTVFVETNRFKKTTQYYNQLVVEIPSGTDSTSVLAREARKLLTKIYQSGIEYKKIGVILGDLSPNTSKQYSLFDDREELKRDSKLFDVIDKMNSKFGRESVAIASAGLTKSWEANSKMRSPNFTTQWNEIPSVR